MKLRERLDNVAIEARRVMENDITRKLTIEMEVTQEFVDQINKEIKEDFAASFAIVIDKEGKTIDPIDFQFTELFTPMGVAYFKFKIVK